MQETQSTSATEGPAEQWRPIAGSPGYEVSNVGRVRSPRRVLKLKRSRLGYLDIRLPGSRYRPVHCLVMEAFVGPPGDLEVDHVDCDKTHNVLSNLEYVTHRENMRRASANGRLSGPRNVSRGKKLTTEQVQWLLSTAGDGVSQRKKAAVLGVRQTLVSKIMNGLCWSRVTGLKPTYSNRKRPSRKRASLPAASEAACPFRN